MIKQSFLLSMSRPCTGKIHLLLYIREPWLQSPVGSGLSFSVVSYLMFTFRLGKDAFALQVGRGFPVPYSWFDRVIGMPGGYLLV